MYQKEVPTSKWLVTDKTAEIRKISAPVPLPLTSEDELVMQKLIDFVVTSQDETLNADEHLQPAVGLAAPQIGAKKQMYYIHIPNANGNKITRHALINPKIIAHSERIACLQSGKACLSVVNQKEGYVPRYFKVTIQGYDYLKKEHVTITARGYEAIVFQHEQKHLDGILYYDLIDSKTPWNKNENWLYL